MEPVQSQVLSQFILIVLALLIQEILGPRICAKESLKECSNQRCKTLPEIKCGRPPLITEMEKGTEQGGGVGQRGARGRGGGGALDALVDARVEPGSPTSPRAGPASLTRLPSGQAMTLPGEGFPRTASSSPAACFQRSRGRVSDDPSTRAGVGGAARGRAPSLHGGKERARASTCAAGFVQPSTGCSFLTSALCLRLCVDLREIKHHPRSQSTPRPLHH